MSSDLVRRIGVSVVLLVVGNAMTRIPVPGVSAWFLETPSGRGAASVGALGVLPLLTGFLLVEAVAFAVPGWRPLVRGGPAERQKLWRAGVIAGLAVAAFQGFVVAMVLETMSEGEPVVTHAGLAFRSTTVAAMVAGTATLAVGARLVDDHGLGSGYAVLVAAEAASASLGILGFAVLEATPPGLLVVHLVPVLLAGALVFRASAPPYPTWGVAWLAGLPASLVAFGSAGSGWAAGIAVVLVSAAVLAGAVRPVQRVAGVGGPSEDVFQRRVAAARASRPPTWLRLVVVALLLASPGLWGSPLTLSLVEPLLLAAIAADLADEVRARWSGPLVAAWPIHQPYLVRPALDALAAAGIPASVRSVRYRALLGPFDPRVPIVVLVPPDRLDEADRVLEAALAVRRPAEPRGDGTPGLPVAPSHTWAPPADAS